MSNAGQRRRREERAETKACDRDALHGDSGRRWTLIVLRPGIVGKWNRRIPGIGGADTKAQLERRR